MAVVVVYQFYRRFRIRLGIESISGSLKFFLDFCIVFDDTVVNQYHRMIVTAVGMRVGHGRLSMSGPARVADSAGSVDSASAVGFLDQRLKPSFGFNDLDFLIFFSAYGDAGRIVSSVFQPGKPGEQDRGRLFFPEIPFNSTLSK